MSYRGRIVRYIIMNIPRAISTLTRNYLIRKLVSFLELGASSLNECTTVVSILEVTEIEKLLWQLYI